MEKLLMDNLKKALNGKNGKAIKLVGVVVVVLCAFFAFKISTNPTRDFNNHAYYVVSGSDKPEDFDNVKSDSDYVRFHDDGTTSGVLASGDWKIKGHKLYVHFDAVEEYARDKSYIDLSSKTKVNGHVAFPEKDTSGTAVAWWVQNK